MPRRGAASKASIFRSAATEFGSEPGRTRRRRSGLGNRAHYHAMDVFWTFNDVDFEWDERKVEENAENTA